MSDRIPSHETPLVDPTEHAGETRGKVWVRRLLFVLLMGLCVSFAAPAVGTCSGVFKGSSGEVWGTFEVAGRTVTVTEGEFQRAKVRYDASNRLFGEDRFPDEVVWQYLILDEAAKAQGIHASDAQVVRELEKRPEFTTNGNLDERKYRDAVRALTQSTGVDHEGVTWALRSMQRVKLYVSTWATAYDLPRSRDAYEQWKKENVKLTVDVVAQPYGPLQEKARAMPVTDDDVQRAAVLPKVVEKRTIAGRRALEGAFVRVADVTDEQRKAMEEYAAKAGLLTREDPDATLESLAWAHYWSNRQPGGPYSSEAWTSWQKVAHARALEAWEKAPEPKGPKPEDPTTKPWPEDPRAVFYERWFEFAAKETLAREVLRDLALRAERENKSLRDLLPDYERFGVRVVETAEPLTDAELAERFPEGLARESDLEQEIRRRFRAPAPGAAFVPAVLVDPVQTMRLADRAAERGWIVVRWTKWEPARERDLSEIRPFVEDVVRESRASELARDVLAEVRKKAEADPAATVDAKRAALRAAAKEAQLDVLTIRRFNARTEKPVAPVLAADATPEARAAAHRVAVRARVLEDYPLLSKQLSPGGFRDPILLDPPTETAYLMLLVEKHEPEPIEMDAATLRTESMLRRMQEQRHVQEALSLKSLTERFRLRLADPAQQAVDQDRPDGA